jgi:hypothetical protein
MAENQNAEQNVENTVNKTGDASVTPKQPVSKFGKQETYTATDGTKYTFQFPGTQAAMELLDRAKNNIGVVVDSKYKVELMEHIIVDPKVSYDYFDEHDGFIEVTNEADRFLGSLL